MSRVDESDCDVLRIGLGVAVGILATAGDSQIDIRALLARGARFDAETSPSHRGKSCVATYIETFWSAAL